MGRLAMVMGAEVLGLRLKLFRARLVTFCWCGSYGLVIELVFVMGGLIGRCMLECVYLDCWNI